MNQFTLAIITALGSTGLWGVLQLWLTHRLKKTQDAKDAKAKEKEDRKDAEAKEVEERRTREAAVSQTWYQESRHHYELANQEASEARNECKECRKELEHTRRVIYLMFEELEDQVIPMLSDQVEIRAAARGVIKKARESLRAAG